MIVSTWNNGDYNKTGSGYGIRILKSDRDKFSIEWNHVIISIINENRIIKIPLKKTFWSKCCELRSKDIGEFLIKHDMGNWEKRSPYKLLLFKQYDNVFALFISNPKKILTWAKKSEFTYDGNVAIGTRIYFGSKGSVEITKQKYEKLLNQYSNRTIEIGTSRDNAPNQSLGNWLQNNVSKTAIASYVGSILLSEGYAEKIENSMIKLYSN